MNRRWHKALVYRREGLTYKQIAEILEVSTSRARDLVLLAERYIKKKSEVHEIKEDWRPHCYGFSFTTLRFYCESLSEHGDCDG